jgi:hypothetical protein
MLQRMFDRLFPSPQPEEVDNSKVEEIIMNPDGEGEKDVGPRPGKVSCVMVDFRDRMTGGSLAKREFYGHIPFEEKDYPNLLPVITGISVGLDSTDVIRASAEEALGE